MAELLRDLGRALIRYSPAWLPGAASCFGMAALDLLPLQADWIWLILFGLASLVLGILVQALRFASFDVVHKLLGRMPPQGDSLEATRYALYANFATLWAVVMILIVLRGDIEWGWRGAWLFLVAMSLVELGLVLGAARSSTKQTG